MIGQIKSMKLGEPFGFIKPDDKRQKEHFFHISGCIEFEGIRADYIAGDNIRVEFDSVEGKDGKRRAENVRRIYV